MRNDRKTRNTGFITCLAVFSNWKQSKSPDSLNTLLSGWGTKRKKNNSPLLYPSNSNPNGPFWWQAQREEKKPKAVKSPGFPMMSSGTAACTKASGKGEQGGFPNVLPTHVWHTRVTTHFNKSSYHSALSINSIRGVFFLFLWRKAPNIYETCKCDVWHILLQTYQTAAEITTPSQAASACVSDCVTEQISNAVCWSGAAV